MAAWAGDDKQFIDANKDTPKHLVTIGNNGVCGYRPGLSGSKINVNAEPYGWKAINVTVTGEMWALTGDETNNVRFNPTVSDPDAWVEVPGTFRQIAVSSCGMHVYGVQSDGTSSYRPGFCDGDPDKWEAVEGPEFEYICCSAGGKHVWGMTKSGTNEINGMLLSNLKYKPGKDGEWVDCEANLKQVSISADGNHVYALNSAGVMIYRPGFGDGSPEGWVEACPGGERFNCVAVSFDGEHVYGSSSAANKAIWYRNGQEGAFVCKKKFGTSWVHTA